MGVGQHACPQVGELGLGTIVVSEDVTQLALHWHSVLHAGLLDVWEEVGWGWQPFLFFAIMLAAWFSPKALSASSGLPSLAQIALSLSWASRVL